MPANKERRRELDHARYMRQRDEWLRRTRARHKAARDVLRDYVLHFLANHPCVDCGEADPVVLDFDHMRDKSFGIAKAAYERPKLAALQAEIAKCEVRCANCHRRKTHREGGYRSKHTGSVADESAGPKDDAPTEVRP